MSKNLKNELQYLSNCYTEIIIIKNEIEDISKYLDTINKHSLKADKLEEYKNLLENKINVITEKKMNLFKLLETIPSPNIRIVMECRYMHGMRWEEICSTIHYEWSQVHRFHCKGLKFLEEYIEKNPVN